MPYFTVGRFQTDQLTGAHRELLDRVASVPGGIVFIGSINKPLNRKNPLSYDARQYMINCMYGDNLKLLPLPDFREDKWWRQDIDALLELRGSNWTGISGPDGFAPIYQQAGGRWPIEIIDPRDAYHASQRRTEVGFHTTPILEQERKAMIWLTQQQFPQVNLTVDIIVQNINNEILLGRKNVDGGLWRFPGGFVDPSDKSVQDAAKRELLEETGLSFAFTPLIECGMVKIDDWRLRGDPDRAIYSMVFRAHVPFPAYVLGATAGDDLDKVEWFAPTKIFDNLVDEHKEIWRQYESHFTDRLV